MLIDKKIKGIRVVADKTSDVHSATVGVWVRAGSVFEQADNNGISHYIEHMLFKGTKNRNYRQLAEEIDNIGGQMNAFTAKEYTCYYAKVIDEHQDIAADVLFDMLSNSIFPEEEMKKEKGVVLEEIAMSNDTPDDVSGELVSTSYFAGTPLERTILGPAETVSAISRQDIDDYMNKRYTKENVVVAASGNIDMDLLCDMVANKLNIAEGGVSAEVESYAINNACFVVKPKEIEQVHISMGLPAYSYTDKRKYAVSVINNIFGGAMSSRLFQRIREELGMAYSVYSYPSIYMGSAMTGIYAATNADNAPGAVKAILEEIERMRTHGITEKELKNSKEQLRGGFILSREGSSQRMSSIGKSALLVGELITEEQVLDSLASVTMEDVDAAISEIMDISKLTATFVGAVKKEEELKEILCR